MNTMKERLCPSCGHVLVFNHPLRPDRWSCPANMPYQGCGWVERVKKSSAGVRFGPVIRKGPNHLHAEVTFPINYTEVSAMLSQLKNFVVDRLDMDDLFALSAFGKSLRNEYVERGLPHPEWLTEQLASLDREILARRRDELEKRLREIKAQRSTLETASEKRDRLDREQQDLEKQLAGA